MSLLDIRSAFLLSFQRALVGEVTPELRAIAASISDDVLRARFIFDVPVTGELRDDVSSIESEVAADFPIGTSVKFTTEFLPVPQRPTGDNDTEYWAYLRRDSSKSLS